MGVLIYLVLTLNVIALIAAAVCINDANNIIKEFKKDNNATRTNTKPNA